MQTLDPSLPVLARLDGHTFSKFTAGLTQPFDRRFTLAMELTTSDLMTQFHARLGYTQSDEITLVWVPTKTKDGQWQAYDFAGRATKLATLMAGYASIRFSHHLHLILADPTYGAQVAVMAHGLAEPSPMRDAASEKPLAAAFVESIARAHFDARLFQVPSLEEAVNAVYWRNSYDCVRNVVSKASAHELGHKKTFKLNTDQKVAAMREAGVDPAMLHPSILFGCFCKTEHVQKQGADGTPYTRNEVLRFSTRMSRLHETMPLWTSLFGDKYVDRVILEQILALPSVITRE